MKMMRFAFMLVFVVAVAASGHEPVIDSFSHNGTLVCTNLGPNATCRVEWASSPSGPWRVSWDGMTTILADSNGTMEVSVPMFYRVVQTDEATPEGMVLIPSGSFQMGDNHADGYDQELPVHSVYVSAFYMDRYEVTNDEMVEVLNWAYGQDKLTFWSTELRNAEGDSKKLVALEKSYCRIEWTGSQFVMKADKGSGFPCVEVSWYGAVAYCNYRSEKEGLTPCYDLSDWSFNSSANGYRLPTEAQWEKAARGGLSGKRFPWGATINHNHANYFSNNSYSYDTSVTNFYHPDYFYGVWPLTSPVGDFAPNGYGLYAMSGNVWEWCWDRYDSEYYGTSPGTDPSGPVTGTDRVARGGAFSNYPYYCRVTYRSGNHPGYASYYTGFRTVLPAH